MIFMGYGLRGCRFNGLGLFALVPRLVDGGNPISVMLSGFDFAIRVGRGLEARCDLDVRSVFLGTEHTILLEICFGIPGPSQLASSDTRGSREANGYLGRENILECEAVRFRHVAFSFVVDPL